jgi:hypothetical protein
MIGGLQPIPIDTVSGFQFRQSLGGKKTGGLKMRRAAVLALGSVQALPDFKPDLRLKQRINPGAAGQRRVASRIKPVSPPASEFRLPNNQTDFLEALFHDFAVLPPKLTQRRAVRRMIGAQISKRLINLDQSRDFLRTVDSGGVTVRQHRQ